MKGIRNISVIKELIQNYSNGTDSDTGGIPLKNPQRGTEYKLQFGWPKNVKLAEILQDKKRAAAKKVSSTIPVGGDREPVPVHKKRMHDMVDREGSQVPEMEPLVNQNGEVSGIEDGLAVKPETVEKRVDLYSEYKKNFRPFSQYDYVAGKFFPKDSKDTSSESISAGSWYDEVLELRKKAGEYKHRGWGIELVPEHLAEVYNKQIALWEHVSRRSSLSALTLATTTQKPRVLTKQEKRKEIIKKVPGKAKEVTHRTRAVSTDRTTFAKKIEKTDEAKKSSLKAKKDMPVKHTFEKAGSTASSVTTSGASPKRHVSIRTPASSSSPAKSSSISEAQPRPTTLAPNAHCGVKMRDRSSEEIKKEVLKRKLPGSAVAFNDDKLIQPVKISETDVCTRKNKGGEVAKKSDEIDISNVVIIKSPPEPTKLKSPEQMMIRSPEPVNWTVPLDTGKVFTVTQSILPASDLHQRAMERRAPSPTPTILQTNVNLSVSSTERRHSRKENGSQQRSLDIEISPSRIHKYEKHYDCRNGHKALRRKNILSCDKIETGKKYAGRKLSFIQEATAETDSFLTKQSSDIALNDLRENIKHNGSDTSSHSSNSVTSNLGDYTPDITDATDNDDVESLPYSPERRETY